MKNCLSRFCSSVNYCSPI